MIRKNTLLLTVIIAAPLMQGLSLTANAQSQYDQLNEQTLHVCSAAPYETETVITDTKGVEIDRIPINPGQCRDYIIATPPEGATLYSRATLSASLSRLNKHQHFSQSWSGVPVFAPGRSGAWACINKHSGAFAHYEHQQSCGATDRRMELGYLPGDASGFALFIEDPYLCHQVQPTCSNTDGVSLLSWAKTLERSLAISLRAWTEADQTYGLIPTALVFETADRNGPFNRGVLVTDYLERTPLGSPVPARNGDIIVSFNGEPIYDRDDLIMLVIDHGRRYGYEEPYTLELLRGSQRLRLEGYLVFHKGVYGSFFQNADGSCKNTTGAILSSSLNEATFYTKPILACVDFDLNGISAHRNRQCEFAVRQLTAAYRQYCPGLSRGSAIVGSIFMPGREASEAVVRKLAVKNVSKMTAALIVEAAEETARAIITMPPGISIDDNWGSVGQQVGFGMAVGTGVRLITLK